MSIKDEIYNICQKSFQPDFLEIIDFSHMHKGHLEVGDQNKETHFQLEIKSSYFDDKNTLESHQIIYKKLDYLMKTKIHALQIKILV